MRNLLFIRANPIDTDDLRLDIEENNIREELERSQNNNEFTFQSRGAVSIDDLHRLIVTIRPHILHISGHANSDSLLLLEDNDGYATEIPIEQLTCILDNNLFQITYPWNLIVRCEKLVLHTGI